MSLWGDIKEKASDTWNDAGTETNTRSTIAPKISSGLSTQILVKVGNNPVGAIQSLVIKQDREMCTWEEVGTDGIIEIHPKGSAKISLEVNRIVFDGLRLPEAFSRGFVNIQSQRVPFDIYILDRSTVTKDSSSVGKFTQKTLKVLNKATNLLSQTGANIMVSEPYMGHIVHIFNNCWFRNYSPSYKADEFVLSESATIVCEYVTTHIDGRNVSEGGLRGLEYSSDTIERNTDLVGVRGKFYPVVDNRTFGYRLLDAIF
jgi:hypothetical protein